MVEATNREKQANKTINEIEFNKLEYYENQILEHHGKGEYEQALELLEESQRITKTHFGTQSNEVSIVLLFIHLSPITVNRTYFCAVDIVHANLCSNLQHLQHARRQEHTRGQKLGCARASPQGKDIDGE